MTGFGPDMRRVTLPAALLGTVGVFLAVQVLFYLNAGVFEYPLDDVYIHLAMAEQIAKGGYGVNPGEYASASSSPLYSVLLVPLADSEGHRLLPLAWNLVAIGLIGGLVASTFARAFEGRDVSGTLAFAVTLVAAIFLHGGFVAAIGMEHSLHVAVSLMVLVGLIDFLKTDRISLLLIAGIVLGPILRFEGVALSLLACAVLMIDGRARPAVILALLSVVPLALFMTFLTRLGLEPLPSSVLVKLNAGGGDFTLLERTLSRVGDNLSTAPGFTLALVGGVALLAGLTGRMRESVILGAVTALAVLAHLVFGRIGWMDRYENYILVFSGMAALFLTLGHPNTALSGILSAAILLSLASNFFPYASAIFRWYQHAPAAVHLQHGQMARFAQDYAGVPVAVNDLGYVAYRNPEHVLDLWGLASAVAGQTRLDPKREEGWAGPLAEAKGVQLVMIYDRYLPKARDPSWVRLGTLDLLANQGMAADRHVAFYATDPSLVRPLIAKLEEFVPTLPEGAAFSFDKQGSSQTEGEDATQ